MYAISGERFGTPRFASITDPITAGQRWVSGAQAATQKYVDNAEATTIDPTQRAIAAQNALLANFSQAVTSGRWARNLAAVGAAGWKASVRAKAANYGTGVSAAQEKYVTAVGPLFQFMAQEQSKINAMPSGTLSDSIARMTTWATDLHNYKLSR